jgi:hypothetical protein
MDSLRSRQYYPGGRVGLTKTSISYRKWKTISAGNNVSPSSLRPFGAGFYRLSLKSWPMVFRLLRGEVFPGEVWNRSPVRIWGRGERKRLKGYSPGLFGWA